MSTVQDWSSYLMQCEDFRARTAWHCPPQRLARSASLFAHGVFVLRSGGGTVGKGAHVPGTHFKWQDNIQRKQCPLGMSPALSNDSWVCAQGSKMGLFRYFSHGLWMQVLQKYSDFTWRHPNLSGESAPTSEEYFLIGPGKRNSEKPLGVLHGCTCCRWHWILNSQTGSVFNKKHLCILHIGYVLLVSGSPENSHQINLATCKNKEHLWEWRPSG